MEKKDVIKRFIATCTLTFKAFDYHCKVTKSSATIWNFVATNESGENTYAVYCAPKLEKSKSLIRLAKQKLKPNMRLVVVTQAHSEEELESSREDGYTLITLEILNKYGEEMLQVRAREAENSSEAVMSRENRF